MGLDLNNRKNSTYLVLGVGLVFLVMIMISQLANQPSLEAQKIAEQRENKDLAYRNSPDSPIPLEVRKKFTGLAYFPIQDGYRTEAELVRVETPDTVQLLRTRGIGEPEDKMVRVGKLRFTLQGQVRELTAFGYLDPALGRYFVPFRDRTSGESTYGGGRYLEVPIENPLTLDFNLAYNPDCAYNKNTSCPIPPRENFLDLEVRAGELDFPYAHLPSND